MLKTLPLLWGDFLLYDVPVRRLIESESKLKRLEDKVSFQEVDVKLDRVPVELYREGKQLTTELLEGGKTKLTREEPKDYSRVIAANMIVETNLRRTWLDNVTRVLVGSVGVGLAYFYKRVLDKREAKQDRREEELDNAAIDLNNDLDERIKGFSDTQMEALEELKSQKRELEEREHKSRLLFDVREEHIENLEHENEALFYGWRLAEDYVYQLCRESVSEQECVKRYEEIQSSSIDRKMKSVFNL